MEQSKIAIENTIEYFESLEMFRNLNDYQMKIVLGSLNNIAISGYNDARKSFSI
jgi:hypothetical protein